MSHSTLLESLMVVPGAFSAGAIEFVMAHKHPLSVGGAAASPGGSYYR